MSVEITNSPSHRPARILSHINRPMLADGRLARWIDEGRVVGAMVDPPRFAHEVALSPFYDSGFRRLIARGDDARAIYQDLILEDVRDALDLFRPLFGRSGGTLGFVSLGITPGTERNATRTFDEAERLRHQLDSRNALIAIPGGPGTWKAVEDVLRNGINLEVTNLVDEKAFETCLKAYMQVLRRGLADVPTPIDRVAMIVRVDEFASDEDLARIAACASMHFQGADWRELSERGGRFPHLAAWRSWPVEPPAGIKLLEIVSPEQLERPELSTRIDVGDSDSPLEALAEAEESFTTWMQLIESKRARLEQQATTPGQTGRLGPFEGAIHDALDDLEHAGAVRQLWQDDASARGWLNASKALHPHLDDLAAFADEVADAGFTHVLLVGRSDVVAGAEVLRRTNIPIWGHPELLVLDSLVPATLRRFASAIQPETTLVVVAEAGEESVEAEALYAYFLAFLKSHAVAGSGSHFIAITDPGSALESEAKVGGFRRIFLNPPAIPPADSALSFPGIVPASLMGLDAATLVFRADGAVDSTRPWTPIEQNPGATLGAALGALARAGRDKLTLVCPAPIEAFGLLLEPLITSRGLGIRPIIGEPLGSPAVYGNDRAFVQIRTVDGRNTAADAALDRLADAGHPVITHILGDTMDLSAEFFRWQVATALAATMLPAGPPDLEPAAVTPEPLASDSGLTLASDAGNAEQIRRDGDTDRSRFVACLSAHFARVRPGDCVTIVSYFDEREVRDVSLDMIRATLRDVLRVATTSGYASRSRHGSSRLGETFPDSTVLLQLTADEGEDVPLPGQELTFGTLNAAFALRDFRAIAGRNGRALRIELGGDVDRALATLRDRIGEALEGLR